MTESRSFEEIKRMRPEVLRSLIHWLEGLEEEGGNLTAATWAPHLRPTLSTVYPAVLALYSLVLVAAVFANCCLVLCAHRHRLYLLLNLSLGNLLLSCPVLPPTVAVLIFHDWVIGRTACHFLPMMQDMSLHVTVLSHLALVVDGHRVVQGKARVSPTITCLTAWSLALCLVLPFRPFITYTDLTILGPQFQGLGICTVSLTGYTREYIRAVVVIIYILPVCVMSILYLRILKFLSRSSKHQETALGPRSSSDSSLSSNIYRNNTGKSECELQRKEALIYHTHIQSLGAMAAVCCGCLCPLMVLRVTKTRPSETSDSSGHFDLLYCLLVWLAFLPTLTSPLIFLYGEFNKSRTANIRQFVRPRRCSDCQGNDGRGPPRAGGTPRCSPLPRARPPTASMAAGDVVSCL